MGTYNIHSYNNAEDNDEPSIVVELNDDDTEIVSVTSRDPEQQEEDEKSLRNYVENGFTPLEAMERYAGPYGQVWSDGDSDPVEESTEETPTEEAPVEEAPEEAPEAEEEGVVSAAEDAPAEEVSPQASRITSGATMAMVSDAGVVVTLFQADDEGNLSYRMDGGWKPLVDPDTLSELSFVGVDEEALNLYDEHQQAGNLVPIQYYPASEDGPYWTDIVVTDEDVEEAPESDEPVEEEEVDEEAVTAALTLDSPGDLENAISAALLNKDLRWFVERRVAALGLEAELPWQKD